MTIEDIAHLPRDMLTAEDVAPFLECDPHKLRVQAQNEPTKLGFPVIVSGSRVRIPRDGFVFFIKYGHPMMDQARLA